MPGPAKDERLGVGMKQPSECQCVFLRFDMGTDGFLDHIRARFGNFNLVCGACGETAGGLTDGTSRPRRLIWTKAERHYFGTFHEVAS